MRNFLQKITFLAFGILLVVPMMGYSQCSPNTNLTTVGLYPDPLAAGCMGVAYSETLTFVYPADTTIDPGSGPVTVPIDSFIVNGMISSPTGLNTLTCTPANCTYMGVATGLGYGCFILSGTPTSNTSVSDQLCVSVTGFATVLNQVQVLTDTFCVNFLACTSGGCNGPTANFFFNAVGQTANITNTSVVTGSASYSWDFGDGGVSSATSPAHPYINAGTYQICLTVTDSCGVDSFCKPISIGCLAPNASFSSSVTTSTVTLTDGSSNTPASWAWDFGDGNTSTSQSPTHTYATNGSYTVCLLVNNACGADSTCQTVTVSACSQTTANWTYQATGLSSVFSDQSSSNPQTTWLWDFGDGNNSTSQNPTNVYNSDGQYLVCLTVTDSCGTDSSCQVLNLVVGCNSPIASFTPASNGLAYTFTDGSSNTPTSWNWTFGDGNTSNLQSPTHTYSTPGTYQVCLTVGSACGANTICQNLTANCTNPGASFASIPSGLQYGFVDQSLGNPNAWAWDFGDGNTSTMPNPSHTYSTPGTYTVCLAISNPCGNDTVCSTLNVTCQTTASGFAYTTSFLTGTFSDQTTGSPISWFWTFGDGSQSTSQNPTHVYSSPGTYSVCLNTTNTCGADSVCQSVTISCPTPQASFGHTSVQNTVSFTDASSNATSWSWNFGDGVTSIQQNPVHIYNSTGNFAVCLTVTSPCGSHTVCQNVQISCPAPTASFTNSVSGLTVNFTDGSNGATTWFWNFGDGSIDNQQNTSHTFSAYGVYVVCLTVGNGCNSSTDCQQIVLSCPAPTAAWVFSQNGSTFSFQDQSTGATSWAWGFGDGTFSTLQNPTHTYGQDGQYTVCLYSTNDCGTDTSCSILQTVGVEKEIDGQLSVYPNPSKGMFTLEMLELVFGDPVQISITDLQGRKIWTETLSVNNGAVKAEVDLSKYATGSYFLQVKSGEREWHRMLVKR